MRDVDAVPGQAEVAGAADLATGAHAVLQDDGLVRLREQRGLDGVAPAVRARVYPKARFIQGVGSSKASSIAAVAPRLAALATSEAVYAQAHRSLSSEVSLRNACIQALTWS